MTEQHEALRQPTTAGRLAMIVMLALTLVGAGLSVELTIIYHKANSDLTHKSHCSVGADWDCDDVARSKYAVLFGVPVALWGMVGYVIMGIFAGWGVFRRGPRHWPLGVLALLILCSLGMSGYLFWASTFVLKKKCQYCASLYGVNLALLAAFVWASVSRRVGPLEALRQDTEWLLDRLGITGALAAGVLGLTALALVLGPRLGQPGEKPRPRKMSDLVKKPAAPPDGPRRPGTRPAPLPPLPTGQPEWVGKLVLADTPARGPKDADLYIVEFSDYECPFCQMSNAVMEKVLAKHGKRIRLFHRHFPLDKTCFKAMRRQMHPHACFAAAAAICAQQQKKFWAFHDAQFRLGKAIDRGSIRELAEKVGLDKAAFEACLKAPDTQARIQRDIQAAVKLEVRGTPTFFMGGPLLEQFQPQGVSVEMFDKLFEALDKAKKEYEVRRRANRSPGGGAAPRPSAPMSAAP